MSNLISEKSIFTDNSEQVNTSGFVTSVNSGTDITVDNTDPQNPIINFTGTPYTPPTEVANYSALPDPTTVAGQSFEVLASQGTKWLPGSLGGTYYPRGYYYSDGTATWVYTDVPYQATQAQVNTGTNTDTFVTPNTLSNSIWAYTDEKAQDAVGNILTDSSTIDFTYNDVANTITSIVIDDSITNSKLTNVSTQTIKGRTTAGTGDPEDLTKAQAQGILGLTTSSTDNAITRYDGTLGNTQNSTIILNDDGSLTIPGVASPTYTQGKLTYDTDNESLTFFNNDSMVGMQIGQEEWIRVRNVSGSTIANGAVVYLNGASSGLPTIALAKADAAATVIGAGLATESIPNNTIGYVTCIGVVHNVDTSAFTAGQTLFISSTVAGGLVSTAPTAPNYRYRVGIVGVVSATVGTIHVTPSTAALGNGTANQVFGINNAGTAQEVKTVASSSTVTITHTANTITPTIPSNVALSGAPTTTTAAANDNSTKIATTAYVDLSADTSMVYSIVSSGILNPADATAYYSSGNIQSASGTATLRQFKFLFVKTLKSATFTFGQTGNGTGETVTLYLRNITTATDFLIGTFTSDFGASSVQTFNYTGLNISVNTTDQWTVKYLAPTWVTNPTQIYWTGLLKVS
jgi:hypothetical protein